MNHTNRIDKKNSGHLLLTVTGDCDIEENWLSNELINLKLGSIYYYFI